MVTASVGASELLKSRLNCEDYGILAVREATGSNPGNPTKIPRHDSVCRTRMPASAQVDARSLLRSCLAGLICVNIGSCLPPIHSRDPGKRCPTRSPPRMRCRSHASKMALNHPRRSGTEFKVGYDDDPTRFACRKVQCAKSLASSRHTGWPPCFSRRLLLSC
jgi:hypothetical protein